MRGKESNAAPRQPAESGFKPNVRRLVLADVEVAREIASLAYDRVYPRASIERYLRLQPDGWLLAESDGEALGIGGITGYGKYAVIGLMATRPTEQRSGIATAILRRLLELADLWSCPLVGLDATEAGFPLYARFGFVEVDQSLTLTRPGGSAPAMPSNVGIVKETDLDEIVDLDSKVFGASRRRLLERLVQESPGGGFVVRNTNRRMTGYLLQQVDRLGPGATSSRRDCELLIRAALARTGESDLTILIPAANTGAVDFLSSNGFKIQRRLAHMRRGERLEQGDRTRLLALAGYGLG